MKRVIKIINILFILVLVNESVMSQLVMEDVNKVGQAGFKFLSLGVGARNTSMGEAAATNEGDAVSMFWNPAGIVSMENAGFFAGYTQWFAGISQSSAAVVVPISWLGHIGLSVSMVNYGDVEATVIPSSSNDNDIGYLDNGIIKPSASVYAFTYGKSLSDRFQFALTVKYAYENLVAMNKGSIAFDFGTIYKAKVHDIKIAVVMQHFAFSELSYINEDFQLPLTFRVGFSADALSLFGVDTESSKLNLAIELAKPIDYSERTHLGAEYWYKDFLALRAGYKFNYDTEGLTAGFGVKYSGFEFRYSFVNHGSLLGSVNRFGLLFNM